MAEAGSPGAARMIRPVPDNKRTQRRRDTVGRGAAISPVQAELRKALCSEDTGAGQTAGYRDIWADSGG